jgi:hypothetical protein
MPRWLILVHRIPPRPLYLRAKMRQRLADVGAVAVKNAVYLLPHGADALEDLQWIAQEIIAGGGDAHLFEGDFVDGVANEAAIAQFQEARHADYDAVAADARTALKSARSAAAASELAAAHARLMRRLEEIRRIDFFKADSTAADEALAAIETRLQKDRKKETRMVEANPELRGKTWVTRPGVKIDRMASAWIQPIRNAMARSASTCSAATSRTRKTAARSRRWSDGLASPTKACARSRRSCTTSISKTRSSIAPRHRACG